MEESQAPSIPEEPLIPDTLDEKMINDALQNKYEIVKQISKGCYGYVYFARRLQSSLSSSRSRSRSSTDVFLEEKDPNMDNDEEKVALKIVDKKTERRIDFKLTVPRNPHDEILVHQSLSHPHIVEFFGWFETDTHRFIVEEYMEGGDLYHWVNDVPRSVVNRHLGSFLRQLCSAVMYLHEQDIVHYDLKLENILLNRERTTVKLCDFGFASYDTGLSTVNHGSPAYAAPELIWENPFEPKPVDVWSLGVVFYIMLFLRYPFWHSDRQVLFQQITTEEPSWILNQEEDGEEKEDQEDDSPTTTRKPVPFFRGHELTRWMLQKKASARPTITQVLQHEFFNKNSTTK